MLHRVCVPTHPHPCFELCRNRLHHACVPNHPEPTSKDTPQNLRPQYFHLTHPSFELCRNSSPCYTAHVSQPILYQHPKIHHKRLMTQFCKPSLIQPPKIHLSKFQCSPYRRQKCRALQEDTVEWKPVCDLQAKKWFSVSFSGLNYLRAQPIAKMFSRGVPSAEILWLHGLLKNKILKYVKDQKLEAVWLKSGFKKQAPAA